jgi:hypothetical protein
MTLRWPPVLCPLLGCIPSDTIDTLDLPFLMAVIDGLEEAISGC